MTQDPNGTGIVLVSKSLEAADGVAFNKFGDVLVEQVHEFLRSASGARQRVDAARTVDTDRENVGELTTPEVARDVQAVIVQELSGVDHRAGDLERLLGAALTVYIEELKAAAVKFISDPDAPASSG
jgi:hypothetical protein